eukprot:1394090-Amorphochlora_amoeboformis.AAC.1
MAEMASLMPPLAPSRSISSDQTRKQLPRNMSWVWETQKEKRERDRGVRRVERNRTRTETLTEREGEGTRQAHKNV